MPAWVVSALACASLASGCGGGASEGARSQSTAATPCSARPAVKRSLAQLAADVVAIRKAADLPTRNRLLGNHAINVATDRFLADLARSPVDLVTKNRQIDHAMSALVGQCEQCFQAFEAGRPIPAIKEHGAGAGCASR